MGDEIATDWRALNLRLSIFLQADHEIQDADWTFLTGLERPENTFGQRGVKQVWGPAVGATLRVSSQPTRIDVLLLPLSPPVSTRIEDILYVGEFFSKLEEFRGATAKWLENVSLDITRIAFGAVLFNPCESLEATYPTIRRMLKSVQIDSDRAKDVAFSVNWLTPRPNFESMLFGRITKISAVTFQGQMLGGVGPFATANHGFTVGLTPASFPPAHGVHLEIDHSTAADRSSPLAPGDILSIYKDLIDLAIENVRVGEVPCP
jgi:hypothetical protein